MMMAVLTLLTSVTFQSFATNISFCSLSDWEARFRTLVALGTLLHNSQDAVNYAK
jgi:hypothetical protein